MHSIPPARRRWFQFGVRSLLAVVAVVAVSTAFWAYNVNWIRQRHEELSSGVCWVEGVDLDNLGVDLYDPTASEPGALIRAPGLLPFFGEHGYRMVWFTIPRESVRDLKLEDRVLNPSEQADFDRIKRLFPEAEVGESWPD